MNEWAYIKLYNLQVSFCDFIHLSYSFWPLNQNRLVILWYQLLLYSETQVSDVICVFFFRFITSTAQVNKTPYQTGIRTPGKLPLYALVTVECSLSLSRHPLWPPPPPRLSDAYGTLIWKHFRSVEVIVGLVELYRISGRRVSRVL